MQYSLVAAGLDYDHPIMGAIGNGAYGAWVRMRQYSATYRLDGWIPAAKAAEIASVVEREALVAAGLVHPPAGSCSCMPGYPRRIDGYWLCAAKDVTAS